MYTLHMLADHIQGELIIKDQLSVPEHVQAIAPLNKADASHVSFMFNPRYMSDMQSTEAGVVVTSDEHVKHCPVHAIVVKEPYVAFAHVAQLFAPKVDYDQSLSPHTSVGDHCNIAANVTVQGHCTIGNRVELADGVVIEPGCVIGDDVTVGAGTHLKPNVTLHHGVKVGKGCLFHAGVVVGSDGFGLANDHGKWLRIAQLGSVVIGDDVDLGANTTIDRGALEDTVIEEGVKIDNQVHIAHNVVIGKFTAIAAQVGIAGSTQIGAHCLIGGATAINGHITICDRVAITGMSMITKSINVPGVYSSGIPAKPQAMWRKNVVRFGQLNDLANRIKELELMIKQNKG